MRDHNSLLFYSKKKRLDVKKYEGGDIAIRVLITSTARTVSDKNGLRRGQRIKTRLLFTVNKRMCGSKTFFQISPEISAPCPLHL
jgi:hypothetical protein